MRRAVVAALVRRHMTRLGTTPPKRPLAGVVARCVFNPSPVDAEFSCRRTVCCHERDIIKLQTTLLPDAACLGLCLIKSSCCSKDCSCLLVEDHELAV